MERAYIRICGGIPDADRYFCMALELGVSHYCIKTTRNCHKDHDEASYVLLKQSLQEGDLLYIDSLYRLGADYESIASEWRDIVHGVGTDIAVMRFPYMDSRRFHEMGEAGREIEDGLLGLLCHLTELDKERDTILAHNQIKSIKKAQRDAMGDTTIGRPRNPDPEDIEQLFELCRKKAISQHYAADVLKMSRSTFNRRYNAYLKKHYD